MDSSPPSPGPEPRRGIRERDQAPPVNVAPLPRSPTLTDRFDAMTQARITALEDERNLLRAAVDRLQARVDLLGPENARLTESLANAETNSVLATMLIAGGGGIVSYATFFTGQVAPALANLGAGCLLGGIAVMAFQTIRRWQRR
jgi:hypothetical protein